MFPGVSGVFFCVTLLLNLNLALVSQLFMFPVAFFAICQTALLPNLYARVAWAGCERGLRAQVACAGRVFYVRQPLSNSAMSQFDSINGEQVLVTTIMQKKALQI